MLWIQASCIRTVLLALKCLFLICILAGFTACHSRRISPAEETESLIDSLIQIHWVEERFMLVSFGAETVSAINTEKGIVVVDAGISTGLTRMYKEKIELDFQTERFAYLINTHADHDHYRGNSVFQTARVVGHENGPDEMDQYWKDPGLVAKSLREIANEYKSKVSECKIHTEEWHQNFTQQIRYEKAFLDAKNRVPICKADILFRDSMNMDMGDITFEMKYFGRCHSNSDILIFIPELKTLFTGDLLFRYGRPNLRDNNMIQREQWLDAIAWTERRLTDIETLIGGHGQILTKEDLLAFQRLILDKTE